MAISLNTDTQTNLLAANSNLTTASGGGVPPDTSSNTQTSGYGPAVIITLSANAELSLSQVADEYPDAPDVPTTPAPTPQPGIDEPLVGTPPPGGVPVIPDAIFYVYPPYEGVSRGNPNSAAGGGASFSGWAETNGGLPPENGGNVDIVDPVEPQNPPVVPITNRTAQRPSFQYRDSLGRLHQVTNKSDTLSGINRIKVILGIGGVGAGVVNTYGAYASAAAKQIASKISAPLALAVGIGAVAVLAYENHVKEQPETWEVDQVINEDNEPYQYMPPGMEDFSNI